MNESIKNSQGPQGDLPQGLTTQQNTDRSQITLDQTPPLNPIVRTKLPSSRFIMKRYLRLALCVPVYRSVDREASHRSHN